MSSEFVVFDDGEEADWIDPVVSVSPVVSVNETGAAWFVDNGCATYEVPKLPGRTVAIRPRKEAE